MATAVRDDILDYIVKSLVAAVDRGDDWTDKSLHGNQGIRALAYLYCVVDSPLKGSDALADGIRTFYKAIQDRGGPDNRLTWHLAETREFLRENGAADLAPGIDEQLVKGADNLAEHLDMYKHLTHFTASNTGTGTNHVLVYATSVYRTGMVLDRDDYRAIGDLIMRRMMEDQHPDGYWAEATGGPTMLYNHLSYACAGRMYKCTGDEVYQTAAQLGALFHRRFCYPDATDVEPFDGRCRYAPLTQLWGDFAQSETPEGRAYVARKIKTMADRKPPGTGRGAGESLALLCENHYYWTDGPVGTAEFERPHYTESLSDQAGMVRREGPWSFVLQGVVALPVGWGGFFIDRISPFSLWHEKTGLMVNGSGEPDETQAQMFKIRPLFFRNSYSIPEKAVVEAGEPGTKEPATFVGHYRGGSGRLTVTPISDNEVHLDVGVDIRADRYPVEFTLQLELRDGDTVNGRELGKDPVTIKDEDLQGVIDAGAYKIHFPAAGARLVWPHDPYNPYDVDLKKSPRAKYVSLLHLPIGPEGAEIRFEVV